VWSKAVKDTTGLQSYYDGHKNDYLYPVRYDVDIYTCANADVSKQVHALYKKGKRGKGITDVVNKTNVSAVTIESATVTDEEKPMIKA